MRRGGGGGGGRGVISVWLRTTGFVSAPPLMMSVVSLLGVYEKASVILALPGTDGEIE